VLAVVAGVRSNGEQNDPEKIDFYPALSTEARVPGIIQVGIDGELKPAE
jgi:hypothetical protein